jgi:peptidoglycan hydrolase CwlO-like protein
MTTNGNGQTAKWIQWVLMVLIMIAMAVSGYAVNKADNAVCKTDFNMAIQALQGDMKEIRTDIKELLKRGR